MSEELFTEDGHIGCCVFYPPAWGGEDVWTTGFTDEQKEILFNHMKTCLFCRKQEIEATLVWAAHRPREPYIEIITVKNADIKGRHTPFNIERIRPLIEHILSDLEKIKNTCTKILHIGEDKAE